MARQRQLVLIAGGGEGEPASPSLGDKAQVLETLAAYNTAPDGSPDAGSIAYGPGMLVELPMTGEGDPVNQALVTVLDEEIAWPVLSRLCGDTGWILMDPDSGRTFGG